jgi:hypothetical protein
MDRRRSRTTSLHAPLTIAALGILAYIPSAVAASACDEFTSRLIERAIRPAIEALTAARRSGPRRRRTPPAERLLQFLRPVG